MGKILVKKSVDVQYPVSGQPILVTGGGGGGGASPRGMTLQERLSRIGGGTLGALAAATGQHRSLGSLAQGMVSGAAQGKAIGGGLGRMATTRAGQERANLRERLKQEAAEGKAAKQIARRNRGEGFLTNLLNPIGAYNRRVADRAAGRLDFARQMNREAEDYSRNMAELYRDVGREQFNQIRRPQLQQERAKLLAAAKARGGELGAEQKRKLEMLDSLVQRTGAPNLEQALGILSSVNQTASPPPEQVGSNVNMVGGKLTVNGQEVQPDAQGNYSAPGVSITGSSIGGGGPEETAAAKRVMGKVLAAGGSNADVKAAMTQHIGERIAQQNNVGAVNPSEMTEYNAKAIRDTMARRNEKPLATEESHPTQQKIGTAISNVLATQEPETGNPLGNFTSPEMTNSPLATQGLSAANMVAPPSDGVVAETTADKQAENSQMNLDTTPEQNLHSLFEALGPPQEARSAEPIGTGYSGPNPNVQASEKAAKDMDLAGFYAAAEEQSRPIEYDEFGFPIRTGEPMELAFRLLKMMIFNR